MDGFIDLAMMYFQIALCAAINSLPLCLIVGSITFGGRKWLSARARFALWTLVLFRMIMPFSWETPFGLGMLVNRWETNPATPVLVVKDLAVDMSLPADYESLSPVPMTENAITSETWSLEYLLMVLAAVMIASVSLLLAMWFAVTSLRLANRVRRGVEPLNPGWNEMLERGRREFGIRVPVRLRMLTHWNTPATMGFFRPFIILPDDTEALSAVEVQHVFWHELAHIKRGDAAWNCLWIAARCLQWWNPCFWWTQRSWLAERELACDALVMRHLESTSASDYARTIIRFVERLSQSANVPGNLPLPGLVMIVGDKGAIRRRLKALAHPLTIETYWGRWSSFGLLMLLAVIGLTDAAASRTEVAPLNSVSVPAGTVWQFGSDGDASAEASGLPKSTRVYEVSAAIARLQLDEPKVSAEIHAREMMQVICGFFPWINGKPQTGLCQNEGNNFIIAATETQHQAIQQMLSQWQQFGNQQICVEVRFVSTDKELSDFLPASGGQIVSPWPTRELDKLSPHSLTHEVNNSLLGPSFVRVLSPDERTAAQNWLQNDSGSSMVHAPKITVFAGLSAQVSTGIQRPFVTGLRTKDDGTRETQISQMTEGVQFALAPTVHDSNGSIHLDLQVRHSEILEVETLRTKIPGKTEDAHIQIPHVRQSNLQTSITLARDESFLVSPLRRDKNGKLQVYMITPRLISVEDLTVAP